MYTIAFISIPPNLLCFGHLNLVYFCLTDPEAIADELNPLTISHIAKTISCKAIGKFKAIESIELGSSFINRGKRPAANINGAPIRPQTDNQRGMSIDSYNR